MFRFLFSIVLYHIGVFTLYRKLSQEDVNNRICTNIIPMFGKVGKEMPGSEGEEPFGSYGVEMPEYEGKEPFGSEGKEMSEREGNTKNDKTDDECTELFEGINKYRESQGLKPLTRDPILDKAAKVQSDHMASTGKVTHDGPPGEEDFQTRIKNAGGEVGMGNENVAQCIKDCNEALDMWIKSPGHNQNLLSETSKIGLACTRDQEDKPYVTMVASA